MKKKNEIIINNNICTMFLYNRKGEKTRETIFDKKYLSKVKQFRWSAYKHRNTYYVVTNIKKREQIVGKPTRLKLHKLILPCKSSLMVDHRNHDGLDNRLENLRIVTNRINCENKITGNKSGYTGVYWHSRDKVWFGVIEVNGKQIHTGSFKTKEEVSKARELYKLNNIKD